MTSPSRPPVAGEPLRHLSAHARLPLSDDRTAVVGPTLEMVNALVDQLDALDLGEAMPATAFDARWV